MIYGNGIKAVVMSHDVDVNDKGNLFVKVRFSLEDDSQIETRIYLTDKSMGIARRNLRLIGFDIDKRELFDLKQNATLCAGHTVSVDVFQDEYKGRVSDKCEIARPTISAKQAQDWTQKLRAAKKDGDEISDDTVPF